MNTSITLETSDVRQNILDTGQRIMAGKGFSAVGLNEILTTAAAATLLLKQLGAAA